MQRKKNYSANTKIALLFCVFICKYTGGCVSRDQKEKRNFSFLSSFYFRYEEKKKQTSRCILNRK
jgi:hypothetical protein